MNRIIIASEILKIAKEVMAIEFDTDVEKKKYQQEHDVRPGTKLTVKQNKKSPPRKKWDTPEYREMSHKFSVDAISKDHPKVKDMDRESQELALNLHRAAETLGDVEGDQYGLGVEHKRKDLIEYWKKQVDDLHGKLSGKGHGETSKEILDKARQYRYDAKKKMYDKHDEAVFRSKDYKPAH